MEHPTFKAYGCRLSRYIIFERRALSEESIRTQVVRADNDCDKGMGN